MFCSASNTHCDRNLHSIITAITMLILAALMVTLVCNDCNAYPIQSSPLSSSSVHNKLRQQQSTFSNIAAFDSTPNDRKLWRSDEDEEKGGNLNDPLRSSMIVEREDDVGENLPDSRPPTFVRARRVNWNNWLQWFKPITRSHSVGFMPLRGRKASFIAARGKKSSTSSLSSSSSSDEDEEETQKLKNQKLHLVGHILLDLSLIPDVRSQSYISLNA